jgi:hypothetical protein
MPIDHLSRIVDWVDRCRNDLDLFGSDFLSRSLEVSKLLITESSPLAAIDQDYAVSLSHSFGKLQLFPGNQLQL